MKKKNNTKRNLLIICAAAVLIMVFTIAGCIGAVTGGQIETEEIPEKSFAIINISGTIQRAPASPLDTYSYHHGNIMDYVDELIEDETNCGILLHVDSGGGTVFHSDEMYLKLMEYKEKTGRPVNAYFEQTAASGAYYISCAADYISANRNCWTGSIGVILSYTSMAGLYDKLGLEEIIISTGANKGMGSAGTQLTEEQRAIYQSLVDESYEVFTDIVAKSRNMDIEKVKTLADGRVYTAKQALENGLIDYVGTYEEAVQKMKETTQAEPYEKRFSSEASLVDYLLYGMAEIMPESDIQALDRITASQLSGVPLYIYRQ